MRAGLLLDVALMYSDWPLIDNGHGILLTAPAWAFRPLISVCALRRNRMKKVWLHSVYIHTACKNPRQQTQATAFSHRESYGCNPRHNKKVRDDDGAGMLFLTEILHYIYNRQ